MRHRSRLQTLAQSLVLLALLIGPGTWGVGAFAANRFAVANTAWNLTSTWSATSGGAAGASVPVNGDDVFIGETATARAVTIPAGYAAAASSVTLGTTGGVNNAKTLTLVTNTSSLTVSGNLTVNKPGNNSINNLLNVNAGTVTVNGTVTLGGTAGNATRDARIVITTGTLNIGGNLVFVSGVAGNNIIDMSSSSGTINLAGAFTATVGTIQNPGTSVFNYNGTAAAGQTALIGVSSIIYQNLHFNNTGTNGATLGAAVTATNVLGNVRVQSGTLNNGGFAMVGGAGDTFEVANGARFNLSGTSAMATVFTKSFGATSTVNYQGGVQDVSVETYGHLILNGGSTKTPLGGTITVAGDFTLGAGTIYAGNTNNTVVNLAGNFSNSGTFNSGTGLFTFNGTAAQGITGVTTFTNLTDSNTTAAVTANNALTVAGTLTLAASSTLADGGNTISANANVANSGIHSGAGKIALTGGAAAHQLSGTGSFGNLELNDSNGATLNANPTVAGTLTLTGGNFTTGANSLITSANCNAPSVVRTSGHVIGNLQKAIPTGASPCTFEVGTASAYSQIDTSYAGVTTAGNVLALATTPDHPSISSAGIDSAKSVNRYWTLTTPTTGSLPAGGTYDATFNFVSGDVDAGAATGSFVVKRFSGSWSAPTTGTRTATSTQATGLALAATGDFAVGEPASTNFSREKQFIYTRELY